MKPIKRLVVQLSALLLLACAISWYNQFTSLRFAIFLIVWSSWLPLACAAILFFLPNYRSLLAYTVTGTFVFTYLATVFSLYSIYEVAWGDQILQDGVLNDGMIVVAVIFPMWFIFSAPIGALLGVALWHSLRNKNTNQP